MLFHMRSPTLVLALLMGTACAEGTIDDTVPANAAPRARLYAPLAVGAGETVALDASATLDPDGAVVRWRWRLGDGTPEQLTGAPTLDHTFTSPGRVVVQLTVWDDAGASSGTVHEVEVGASPPSACDGTCDRGGTCEADGRCWVLRGEEVCQIDADCPVLNTICVDERCVLPGCTDDRECAPGVCRRGVCASIEGGTDGGTVTDGG